MKKTPLQRVKDPAGRLDWLAAKLLERVVEQRKNPVIDAVYQEVRIPLEQLFRAKLGPRNRKAREFKKYLEQGTKIMQSVQQRRMA